MSDQYAEMAGLDPQSVIFTTDRRAAEVVLMHRPQVNTDAVHAAAEALRELGMVAGAEAKFPRGSTSIAVTFGGDRNGALTDRQMERFVQIVGPRFTGCVDAKIEVYRVLTLRYGQAIAFTSRFDPNLDLLEDVDVDAIASIPGVVEEPTFGGKRLIVKIDPNLVDQQKIIDIIRAAVNIMGVYLGNIENTDREIEGDLWSDELQKAIKLLQKNPDAVHPADSDESSEDEEGLVSAHAR